MELIGEPVTETGLNDLIKLADVDKDGRINYEGKINFMDTAPTRCTLDVFAY